MKRIPRLLSLIDASTAARPWRRGLRFALVAGACLFGWPALAQTLFVLTNNGELAVTTVTNPSLLSTPLAITGVSAGDTLVAIDVRPQNQNLYALGVNATADTAQLYLLSTVTGLAVPIGTAAGLVTTGGATVDFPATGWDIDFNPAVDRLRVVTSSGLNFRINPNTGGLVDGDTFATGINPDGAINGATTSVNATAYTNNFPNNGNITTQYTLDAATNTLFIQNPPNNGTQTLGMTLTIFGVAALDFTAVSGFDIAPGVNTAASNTGVTTGVGIAVLKTATSSNLYTVDLTNGAANPRGNLDVRSLAVNPDLGAAIALGSTGTSLTRFDPTTPGTTTTVSVSGVTAGETLVGIDGRPQTGQTYGLGVNATANTATLYLLDPQSAAATAVGTAGQIAFVDAGGNPVDLPDPATVGYGMDFNPTVDRLRIVTGGGLNFRINPNNGMPVDGNLNSGAPAGTNPDGALNGGATGAQGTAYTNSYAQSLTGGVTTQYSLNTTLDSFFIQNPPNAGTLTNGLPLTLGGAALDFSSLNGFDIPSTVAVTASNTAAVGQGWMLGSVGGVTGVYRLDLATGVATSLGALGAGTTPTAGLVLWAVEPNAADIDVEYPVGTSLFDGGGTVGFGNVVVGSTVTRSILVKNVGGKVLAYRTTVDGVAFSVSQNSAANIASGGSTTLSITYNASGTGVANGTLHIVSNDPDEASFEIALTGTGIGALADDAATVTSAATGSTRIYPLANDGLPVGWTITAVSNQSITIAGRALVIPAGFTGSFTYTASDGTTSGSATVTVTALGASSSTPTRFNGLMTDGNGVIFGVANVGLSTGGGGSVAVRIRADAGTARFTFPTGGDTVDARFALGRFILVRNANRTVSLTVVSPGRVVTGTLLPAVATATPATHHIALASINAAIPGGGYAIATVAANGTARIAGLLPDGRPFAAASYLRENSTIAFFAPEIAGTNPDGFLGGEFVTANLTRTDVTGEIAWRKPVQLSGAIGNHLRGVNTILTANGSIFSGTISLAGAGTLTLSGGNLAATQTTAVTITGGIPTVPAGALRAWSVVTPASGRFSAKVLVPGLASPVNGGGVYLPKSNEAWGFFRGRTVGGRIELTMP